MGIHKLMDLLREKAPGCITSTHISFYSGRHVAIDASMVTEIAFQRLIFLLFVLKTLNFYVGNVSISCNNKHSK